VDDIVFKETECNGTVQSGVNKIEFLIWNTGGQQPPYTGVSGPTA
jgi:hypothetical protein